MSRYYATPLGVVLESVIPSAVKKARRHRLREHRLSGAIAGRASGDV